VTEEKRQPWLKFFPCDWLGEQRLRICSIGARGLWFEMLCFMHNADERGFLAIKGIAVTTKQLAAVISAPPKVVQDLFEELETAGVFSRDERGIVFSRRIRRDVEKASRDKANGSTGGNPSLNMKDNKGVNPPDKAIEAICQKPEVSLRETRTRLALEAFDVIWKLFPMRDGHNPKKPAREKFVRLVVAGSDPREIRSGVAAYEISRRGQDPKFTKQMIVFLNQDGWKDDHQPSSSRDGHRGSPHEDGRTIVTRHLKEFIGSIDEPSSQHAPRHEPEAQPPDAGATPLLGDFRQRDRDSSRRPEFDLEQAGPYGRAAWRS
jgi:hypothetical protein